MQFFMERDKSRDLVNLMIEEIQNKGNIDLVDEIFSEDFVNHHPPANISNDRNGMRQLFSMIYAAFPDGRITIGDQISDGKKVWTRKSFRGTHTGNFGSIQPSGKVITYQVIDILGIEGGKITEHWSVLDRYSLLQQLGVIP
jgi:predicted ester cyclase